MKLIPLSKGQFAMVDDLDFDDLNKYRWYATLGNAGYYAKRAERTDKKRDVLMARQIMGVTDSRINVDHIDNNTLNNQRHNLRECLGSQNMCNRRSARGSSSRYLGVSFFRQMGNWKAQTQKNGKRIYLGLFDSEIEAAKAYDMAAKELHGEFANLNFPELIDTKKEVIFNEELKSCEGFVIINK